MAASVASSEKSPATSAPANESATDITNTAMEKAAAGTGSTGFGTGAGAGKVELFGVVDSGNFRKQGSYIASWKVRQYIIKGDGSLVYLDPTSGKSHCPHCAAPVLCSSTVCFVLLFLRLLFAY
jgi:hypothetical protein